MVLCDYTKGEKTSISLLHFCTRIIISVALQEIDNAPNAKSCSKSDNQSL